MKKHLITQAIIITGISLFTTACVSPRQTAKAGASVGRLIALPIGFAVAVLDEAGLQSLDIVEANPRYDPKDSAVSKTGAAPSSIEPPAKKKTAEIRPTTKSEWISKGATFTLSSSDPSSKALPSLLTYEGELHGESESQYAVHSNNSDDPHIIIDLGAERVIDRVVINGRRGFRTRQRHLAISVSNDKSFDLSQPLWNARKSLVNYTIVLWKRPKGRYVKLGVVGKGILNLKGVKVLGW